jgi:hypothetical protein
MKVTYRMNACVFEESSGKQVDPPPNLNGWSYQGDPLSIYFDSSIADQGVVGGVINASITRNGVILLIIDYWVPKILDNPMIESLKDFTISQLEDGVGEGGFEVTTPSGRLLLMPDLDLPIEVEQVDDGKEVKPPSRVAIAARDGDLLALQNSLVSSETFVDDLHQGYTGLHMAILYGKLNCALLLISHGANVNKADQSGKSPLELCALSNSLSDDDSALLTQSLLSNGADPSHFDPTGKTAKSLAELRRKQKMVKVLSASV